jgi:gluconolactonase
MKPIFALLGILVSLAVLTAQTPPPSPFRIERLDPALDDVIAPDAQLEMLGDRFALTEGPVWVPRSNGQPGYLLFSDNAANVIYKWQAGNPLSVFLENSGYTGRDTNNVGAQTIAGRVAILLIGSNGLALDPQGRLVVTCDDGSAPFIGLRRMECEQSWPTDSKASGSMARTTSL